LAEELIQRAREVFENQARRRLAPKLALLGPPGSGKSIFLNSLMNSFNLREGPFSATRSLMLDLRSIPIGSQLEIYFHINQALLEEAARIGIDKKIDIKVQISHLRFEEILRELLGEPDEGHLVIFIDHLESVPRLFASDLSHRFRSFLETTEHDSEYQRLGLIIAGAVSLYDLKHGPNSAFQTLPVIRFPQHERSTRVELVEECLKNYMSTVISPDLLNLLADLTGGEPGFLDPLFVHLLKDGKQISLNEELITKCVEDICSHSQVQVLRNLGLHLWGDNGLREIVRDLTRLPSVMPRSAAPDIDRYELSGAVVIGGQGIYGKTREYRFRNGISQRYLTELYKMLETNCYPPKAQFAIEKEFLKLEASKQHCLDARHIWSWLDAVREAWVAITPYNQPKLYLYVTKLGSMSGWRFDADAGKIVDVEIREASDASTEATAFAALDQLSLAFSGDTETVKAFIESDPEQISIAIPLYAREIAIIIVATLSRTDAGRGITEFDLCHWIRFVQNVKQVVPTLTLAELGQKVLQEREFQQTALTNAVEQSRTKQIYLFPNGEAIVDEPQSSSCISGTIPNVEDMNKRCLKLVDQWTDQRKFSADIQGIADQLGTALEAGFRDLARVLRPVPQIAQTVITSNVEGLKIPFELFPHARSHLSLLTGVSRRLMGHELRADVCFTFDQLLKTLMAQKQDLRVLLVASHVDESQLQPAAELKRVREHIEAGCRKMNLRTQILELLPQEATLLRVDQELMENGPYHIFHYTGHGHHYSEDQDASGIALYSENGAAQVVKCNQLRRWFNSARSWLAYLSCCHSSAASGTGSGLSSKYVGMIDAVVAAGVPNVIGFRCLVSDTAALHLADEFYRYLFTVQETKDLSKAMLAARKKVEGRPQFFDSWASAMLVTQYL